MKKQDVDLEQLKQLYETTDLSLTEIGEHMNLSYDVIKNRINKYNYIRPNNLIESCEQKRRDRIKTTEMGHKKQKHNEIFKCSFCDKEIIPTRQQRVNYSKGKDIYCSIKCRNNSLKQKNTLERPKLVCCICGKDVECTPDRFARYKDGQTQFFCSQSCIAKYSLSVMDMESRNQKIKQLMKDKDFIKNRTLKMQQTNLRKYGVTNYAKTEQFKQQILAKKYETIEKQKQTWQNMPYEKKQQIARKMSLNRKNNIASDGTCFDSSYELYVYEFCKRNNIPIETQIPLEFNYNGEKHTTFIDFKIDDMLFECKGGHLINGLHDDVALIPQSFKLEIYKKNKVIVITDIKGANKIPSRSSDDTAGLKYLNKCSNPLIGVDIDLFKSPAFPYKEGKPKCFYKVRVDNKRSPLEAWNDEILRWKMIKNRINYVGGFISSKDILYAFNVTRTCKQPSWFDKSYAKTLIQKYITTDLILDPFAGWGTRADACKELDIDYLGCDLNKELVDWHSEHNRNIILQDANNFKYNNGNCSVFICPPYTNKEIYFEGQDISKTQCEWLNIVMKNIPNAKEYLMVCKIVDPGWEQYIVEEKINKSHLGTNKEYVILIRNN